MNFYFNLPWFLQVIILSVGILVFVFLKESWEKSQKYIKCEIELEVISEYTLSDKYLTEKLKKSMKKEKLLEEIRLKKCLIENRQGFQK